MKAFAQVFRRQFEWYERNWRWFVLGTLFLATFLSYFDRQTLNTAIEPIAKEFGLSGRERGSLLSAFIFSYAFCHLLVGFIIDRTRNVRLFFSVALCAWSLSTLLVGFTRSPEQIYWLRVVLGVFGSVNFPICLMIIRRVFPAEERALATGVFSSGAVLATLVAPAAVIYLSNHYDWRYSFTVAGLLGILWLLPWLLIFQRPESRAPGWETGEDKRGEAPLGSVAASLTSILSAPGFWVVALIGLGIVPSLYFVTQWLPSFFTQALKHPYDQTMGFKLALIYFMQDVGLWGGGAIALWLSRRGLAVLNSRKAVMLLAYSLMLSVAVVPFVSSINSCVVLLCLYVCGIGAFQGIHRTFKQDIDRRQVATVAALLGAIETGFAAFVVKRVGVLVQDTGDFTLVFFSLAGLASVAFVVAVLTLRPAWFCFD